MSLKVLLSLISLLFCLSFKSVHGRNSRERVLVRLYNSQNSGNEEQSLIFAVLRENFESNNQISFVEDDCATSEKQHCHFRTEGKSLPYLMRNGKNELLKVYYGPQDLESLKKFCNSYLGVASARAGDPDPESKDFVFLPPLLDANNFEENIQQGTCFVVFYADWCVHCREAKPALNLLYEHYKDSSEIHVFRVDCWDERAKKSELCNQQNAFGYPTMFLYQNGVYIREYFDDRSFEDMIDFLDSSLTVEGTKRRQQYERVQRMQRKAAREARLKAEAEAKALEDEAKALEAEQQGVEVGQDNLPPPPPPPPVGMPDERCFEQDENGLCKANL